MRWTGLVPGIRVFLSTRSELRDNLIGAVVLLIVLGMCLWLS